MPAASTSKARQWEQYSDDEDASGSASASGSGSSDGGAVSNSDDEGEERRPTYAQFEGESDLEADDSEDDDESGSEVSSADDDEEADSDDDAMEQEARLRKQMASVPFGALVKARSKMAAAGSDDEDLLEEDEWAEERAKAASRARPSSSASSDDKRKQVKEQLAAMRGKKAATDDERERRPRRDRDSIPSRSNKHAPQEVSSRRPVSRKRNVVESSSVSASSLRDPRFSNLSGPSVNAGLFSKSYSFLSSARSTELSTLKQTLSKLRKLEANHAGPKASSEEALKIREERANVEQALKREEAKEAERMRRQREGEVMRKFKRENEERVKNGGKAFYLKESAKREMLLQDKFARLAGGNKRQREGEGEASGSAPPAASSSKALRKALDKRRKRNVQKERKALPFLDTGRRSAGGGGGGGAAGSGGGRSRDGPPAKRKRGSRGAGSK